MRWFQCAKEAVIGHLQDATDIGGLALIEEKIRLGRVRVNAVASVPESRGRPSVSRKSREERGCRPRRPARVANPLGCLRQFGEDFHLHGAQQGFARPEAQTGLQDVIWRKWQGCSKGDSFRTRFGSGKAKGRLREANPQRSFYTMHCSRQTASVREWHLATIQGDVSWRQLPSFVARFAVPPPRIRFAGL